MHKCEIVAVKFRAGLSKLFPHGEKHLFCSAVICAAGSGTRMGGVSKQLLDLHGTPCFIYSALAFENCAEVDEIIISAKEEEIEAISSLCAKYKISKLKCVTAGGATRQDSVRLGFEKISDRSKIVMIHDAARPLIQAKDVSFLYEKVCRYGAVCAATKVTDTVKRANKDGVIEETVPRDDLYLVQTPQVFKTDLYRASLAMAQKDNAIVTDDCALAEHAGFSVKLCQITSPNLKITLPGDLLMIEALLKERMND